MTRTPVNKLDLATGELIAAYATAKEAAKENYVSYKGISACINGRAKRAGDYRWEKAKKA